MVLPPALVLPGSDDLHGGECAERHLLRELGTVGTPRLDDGFERRSRFRRQQSGRGGQIPELLGDAGAGGLVRRSYHLGQGGRRDVPSCLPWYRLGPAYWNVVELFVVSAGGLRRD